MALIVASGETRLMLMVLELHELEYQLVFKIPNADVRCHGGLKKGGTRAHQA